jgi:hypothetical protein
VSSEEPIHVEEPIERLLASRRSDSLQIGFLGDLLGACRTRTLSPALARALEDGLWCWLTGDGDLELCLGLRKPRIPVRGQLALRVRDGHLIAAATYCAGKKRYTRARALRAEIERFERALWPHWQTLPAPPAGAAPLDAHLFFAHRLNNHQRIQLCNRQLFRILVPLFQ